MTTYINMTPHNVTVAGIEYPATGEIARVSASFTDIIDGECRQVFGDVMGLPAPQQGVKFIVSGMVFGACERANVVAPATGHPDTKRNEQGHIIEVPCFIAK